jgi:xanthine dehydrogenase YagS FAD-binding subunit
MRPFEYSRARSAEAAVLAASVGNRVGSGGNDGDAAPATLAATQFLAGGTTLLDLMKLDVMRPAQLIDVTALEPEYHRIGADSEHLWLGGMVRMSDAAEHPQILQDYPVLAQSLQLAASAQLRNMATLAGNLLQRTRCNYFRDPSYAECNKRTPGSGCAAQAGCNRKLAVLGVSEHCIAHYPGDLAPALVALDASVELLSARGRRRLPLQELHRLPGSTPHLETVLAPDELIVGIRVPVRPWTRRSLFVKIRDRQSYEFALASAAVALDLVQGEVRQARIALGGVASKPWRAREAEALLEGKALDASRARAAAEAAFASAVTHGDNDFKPELGRRTVVRALLACAALAV